MLENHKKKSVQEEEVKITHRVSYVVCADEVEKNENPGAITIPCTIGHHDFSSASYDNGASINLMPLAIYKHCELRRLRPTSLWLQMVDKTIMKPIWLDGDVLVKVGDFILPSNFVILDCRADKEILIILRRPFLATGRALMDLENNQIKLQVKGDKMIFRTG